MIDDSQIFTFTLILARVSSFIAFFPLFAQRQLPMLVKAGLSLALTLFWYGTLPVDLYVDAHMNVVNAVLFMSKEIGLGFLLAVLMGFIFVPAKIAGAYIGQEIGLALASVSSPGTADASTLVTTLFETFAILLFFGLNLHHLMVTFIHCSLIDVGANISLFDLPYELLVDISASLTEQGNLIVGPAGLCLFVLTIGLALLNKAAPTLNLFSVGMSLRTGLGIFCLVIFFPMIINSMVMYLEIHGQNLESFLTYFK